MWKTTLLRIVADLQSRKLTKIEYKQAVIRVFGVFERETVNLHADVVEELASYTDLGGPLTFWKRIYNARKR